MFMNMESDKTIVKDQLIPRKSRTEVNISRLLNRCELLAKEDLHQNWRLEKYMDALDDAIKKLQLSPMKPSKDELAEYMKRIDFLKRIIETEKLTNPIERVEAVQMLPKTSILLTNSNGSSIVSQIHQRTAAKYNRELKSELLKCDTDRKKTQQSSAVVTQDEDIDAVLKYNRNIQEKIAENMISMTTNMKEYALTASALIKKDIQALEKSDRLTESNTSKLKVESLKLEEHTKSTWRCWVWLMVAIVITIFFNMVLFMKVAKKRM